MHKISVIIPTYNVEDILLSSVETITRQIEYINGEIKIIIVDDCSTDRTAELGKALVSDNIEFYSLASNSGGAGEPRNVGMEKCNTPFLTFLDPDDSYLPNSFEIIFKKISEVKRFDIISFDYLRNGKEVLQDIDKTPLANDIIIEPIQLAFLKSPTVWSKVYNTKFIKRNKFKQEKGISGQDYIFNVETCEKAKKVFNYRIPIVDYDASRDGSATNKKNQEFFDNYMTFNEVALSKFKGKFKDTFCEMGLLKNINWIFSKIDFEILDDEKINRVLNCLKNAKKDFAYPPLIGLQNKDSFEHKKKTLVEYKTNMSNISRENESRYYAQKKFESRKNNRNPLIENVKFLMVIAIVCMHVQGFFISNGVIHEEQYILAEIFNFVASIAVPFFIISAGYFWFDKQNKKHIGNLLQWQFLILAITLVMNYILGNFIFSEGFQSIMPIYWYIPFLVTMMLLTMKQNIKFIAPLFVFMIAINFSGVGDINNFSGYSYMFLIGLLAAKYKIFRKPTNSIFFRFSICIIILMQLLNVGLEFTQSSIFECLMATWLFMATLTKKSKPLQSWKLSKYYSGIFIFHGCFLIFMSHLFSNSSFFETTFANNVNAWLIFCSIFIIIGSIAIGIMFKKVDNVFFSDVFYTK